VNVWGSVSRRSTRQRPRPSIAAVLFAGLSAILGCSEPTPVGVPAAVDDAVYFHDVAPEVGADLVTVCGNPDKRHLLETLGSGVAIADYDGDGDLDIYIATSQTRDAWLDGSKPTANALYRNNGDGSFTDVASEAGVALREWSLGAYFTDYDNDGDKDLFVTCWGPNVLYRNDGDGTFTDVTREAGVAGPGGWSASAAFGDLDLDGDLDLYVTNYGKYDLHDPPFGNAMQTWRGVSVFMGPVGLVGEPDEFYRNDGDGTFADVAAAAGIDDVTNPLYGLGVVMSDLDLDGDLDIFVANDTGSNYLWRNDGGLRFRDVALGAGVATDENAREQSGMGTDAADYDGDGLFDLVVTNFSHDFNTLHRNHGELEFTDTTYEAGFKDSYTHLVWGTKFFDYDNDGWLDLFMANGHIYPALNRHTQTNSTYKQKNTLYRNRGDGTFDNRTDHAGSGLALVESTRGMAVADLDADGDLDMVLTNIDAVPNILINEGGNAASWFAVTLVGTESNRDAVGARVELVAGGRTQLREVNPFGSFLSQSDYALHFGLGDVARVERLTVRWPSGTTEEFHDLEARRRLVIVEGLGIRP